MRNIDSSNPGGFFGIGRTSAVERAARILAAAHRGGGNLLVCGADGDNVVEDLRYLGLRRAVYIDPGAVSAFGEPGDVLILAVESPNSIPLLSAASKARNSGLRRIGFVPAGSESLGDVLEIELASARWREVSQRLQRLLVPEETIILALCETELWHGSDWAVRALRSRGLKVIEVPAAETSGWQVPLTELRRSAELRGIELTRARVISDIPMVLDAAAATGAIPHPVTGEAGAAVEARRILAERVAPSGSKASRCRVPQRVGSTTR